MKLSKNGKVMGRPKGTGCVQVSLQELADKLKDSETVPVRRNWWLEVTGEKEAKQPKEESLVEMSLTK